jgi:hypothetical protein
MTIEPLARCFVRDARDASIKAHATSRSPFRHETVGESTHTVGMGGGNSPADSVLVWRVEYFA